MNTPFSIETQTFEQNFQIFSQDENGQWISVEKNHKISDELQRILLEQSQPSERQEQSFSLENDDSGDDAGIIVKTDDVCFVALADGAGGNRRLGLNPLDFSRAILKAFAKNVEKVRFESHQLPEIILSSIKQVEASRVRGSSTFCCLALNRHEKTLTSLNIGDSGFVLYRNEEIFQRSRCTNDPFTGGPCQLFSLDDSYGLPNFREKKDLLDQSSFERIRVEKNDLIILSSDGLWDVINNEDLRLIIERNKNKSLKSLADSLLRHAIEGYFVDSRDDILIIVCQVVEI